MDLLTKRGISSGRFAIDLCDRKRSAIKNMKCRFPILRIPKWLKRCKKIKRTDRQTDRRDRHHRKDFLTPRTELEKANVGEHFKGD